MRRAPLNTLLWRLSLAASLMAVGCVAPEVVTECVGGGCAVEQDADPRFQRDRFVALPSPDQSPLTEQGVVDRSVRTDLQRAGDQATPDEGGLIELDMSSTTLPDMLRPPVDAAPGPDMLDAAPTLDMAPALAALGELCILERGAESCAEGVCYQAPFREEAARCRLGVPELSSASALLDGDDVLLFLEGRDEGRDPSTIMIELRRGDGSLVQIGGEERVQYPVVFNAPEIPVEWSIQFTFREVGLIFEQWEVREIRLWVVDEQEQVSNMLPHPYPVLLPVAGAGEPCVVGQSPFLGRCEEPLECLPPLEEGGEARCAAHRPWSFREPRIYINDAETHLSLSLEAEEGNLPLDEHLFFILYNELGEPLQFEGLPGGFYYVPLTQNTPMNEDQRSLGARVNCRELCEQIEEVELWVRDIAERESARRSEEVRNLPRRDRLRRCDPLLLANECRAPLRCMADEPDDGEEEEPDYRCR